MTTNKPSMLDVIEFGKANESATVRQYAIHLERLLARRGYQPHHLETLDGDLWLYLDIAPKYAKRNLKLNERIAGWGFSPSTYKQYQSDGRRMIETYHGDLEKRMARRSRQDTFAALQALLPELVEANLLKQAQTRNLPRLIDLARARNWDISNLTRDRLISLRDDCWTSDDWGRVKQGAALLDYLRQFPTCRPLLPPEEIGDLTGIFRLTSPIPDFLGNEAAQWVKAATTEFVESMNTQEGRAATAKEHSEGSRGIYTAALRTYVIGAGVYRDLKDVNGLTPLFDPDLIEKVFVDLDKKCSSPGGLAPRSLYAYAEKLKLCMLGRNMAAEATKIETLISSLPRLIEGRNASDMMSKDTENWCRNLLESAVNRERFETQHLLYVQHAMAALEHARIEGIDLEAFARSPETQPLSREQRRLASRFLRRARMFGTCAAFAAVELDGAPFRKSNVLDDLLMAGHPQTFFDHRRDPSSPRIEIHIPNELLKNGGAMTKRGQSMPKFKFYKIGHGADAYRILSFFLNSIRPLFCGASHSSLVFPAIEPKSQSLVTQTFDSWLAECSTEIGLPLTAHNYRHGVCSIEVYYDPNCYAELETVTGDTEATLRRFYAFVDAEMRIRQFQARRYERRASRTESQEHRPESAA
ncbi:hypothetical protein [Albibacillus kandeliae]|uniref:hypothetical protein n=1 Tax=Albibacillus kandeliae TaxID=2174228 RepID=UPI000D690C38|nr:hypothetical protein [Albibacillus kandeliae]